MRSTNARYLLTYLLSKVNKMRECSPWDKIHTKLHGSCLKLYSENALLDKSNMREDAPITDEGDDERQQHDDDNEEDGVV